MEPVKSGCLREIHSAPRRVGEGKRNHLDRGEEGGREREEEEERESRILIPRVTRDVADVRMERSGAENRRQDFQIIVANGAS